VKESNLYIGTLSGTSADSIDAALFDLGKKIKVIGSNLHSCLKEYQCIDLILSLNLIQHKVSSNNRPSYS
jgi:hypothetical protein